MTNKKEFKNIWIECLAIIKDNVPAQSYKTWFEPIIPLSLKENILKIQVPSQFFYEWIEEHYINLLRKVLIKVIGKNSKLEYSIVMENKNPNLSTINLPTKYKIQTNSFINYPHNISVEDIKNPFVIPGIQKKIIESNLTNDSYTFDNFVEGENNKLARLTGLEVANSPGQTQFNPYFLFGNSGLGKTHLVHAIGLKIKELHPDLVVIYVSAENFIQQFINASLNNEYKDFLNFYKLVDVLIIDDIHNLAGKEKSQDAFFQLFNHMHMNKKQIILTSDKPASSLSGIESRLLGRFKWALNCEITEPDFETRYNIIKNKIYNDGIELDDDIITYLASKIKKNIRELEGAIISLIARKRFNKNENTLEIAKKIIDDFTNNDEKLEITCEYILNSVSEFYEIKVKDIISKTRKREIVHARQVYMYLSKKYTKNSFASIGKFCGDRNHATALHSMNTVQNLMEVDKKYLKEISEVEKKINNK